MGGVEFKRRANISKDFGWHIKGGQQRDSQCKQTVFENSFYIFDLGEKFPPMSPLIKSSIYSIFMTDILGEVGSSWKCK